MNEEEDWTLHPLFKKWAEIYKTKAALLGFKNIGWRSLTFELSNRDNGYMGDYGYMNGMGYVDADTLKPVDWEDRYDRGCGKNSFMKWLKENGEETTE